MQLAWLAFLFFLTASLYSSVGFGGGSTYTALLILGTASLAEVPVLALTCNILVVAIGSVGFVRAGRVPWRKLLPIVVLSVPFAWLGGAIHVPPWLYVGLLAVALFGASLLMFVQDSSISGAQMPANELGPGVGAATGAGLGLLAGITGIGGGIYLAPVLHLRRWAAARSIAAACAVFILVNSVAGLAGHAARTGFEAIATTVAAYWPLLPAVVMGAALGSTIGSRVMSGRTLRVLTALLILYVAIRLSLHFPQEWTAR